jgi:N-acetylglutamate synthase-like GNAT family acetyltransferase
MIRPATAGDVAFLQGLYRRASLHNPGDRDNLLAHPEVLDWSDLAVREERTWLAVNDDGTIAGFVSLRITGTMVELDDLFVDPEWMGRGTGRELVASALATAGRRGFSRVEVTANPHAIGFYQKVGFTIDFSVDTDFGPGHRMHCDL